jgi:filamentous hemagglutinin family protein
MATRAHPSANGTPTRRAATTARPVDMPMLTPLALALMVALPLRAQAQAQVVRPAVPLPTAVPVPAAAWRVQGTGSAWAPPVANSRGGQDALVNQTSQRAIYHWQNFDIGAKSSLTFNLPAAGGALNRVVGSTAPSRIFGQLRSTVPGANGSRVSGGELVLINQNGVLFGPTASVSTGGLIASTLNVADSDFMNGLVDSINGLDASFRYDGDPVLFTDEANYVRVDPGAQITTASGGRVFLFAKNVQNAGTISTPGGQTVLAGGAEVYLADPGNEKLYASEVNPQIPALRGLLVEVGGAAGTVTNSGLIDVPRGNVTLVGMAVNQRGRISATTSVSENGSVMLLARGNTQVFDDGTLHKRATTGGTLTLGAGSVVEVLPDSQTGTGGQVPTSDNNTSFTTSRIELAGQTVSLERNALVRAPGAIVNVRAEDLPDYTPGLATSNSYAATSQTARIVLGEGARIDVSGTTDTAVSVARNFVTTELLGANDLRDAPVQRDGPLYRSRITFDVRRAVPILGDTGAYVRGIKRSVNERLADGGKVSLLSTGAVVTHQDSRIDVSGGQVTHQAAVVAPSTLIGRDGARYSFNDAPKDALYAAIEGQGTNAQDRWGLVTQWTPTRNRVEAGYVEGRSAGSLSVLARDVVLDGRLDASTVVGGRQAAGSDARAATATLDIGRRVSGDFAFGSGGFGTAGLDDLRITAQREQLDAAFWADAIAAALPAAGRIAAETLNRSGFGTIRITADGGVEQQAGADLNLAAQSTLQIGAMGAQGIALNADVRSAGGSLLVQTADSATSGVASGALTVSADSTLDLAGNWVNRRIDGAQAAAAVAGGAVQLLAAHGLDVKDGSTIDVSGGATVSTSGSVSGTAAGRIALESNRAVESSGVPLSDVHLGATLQGHGLAQGGSLRLRAAQVDIVAASADAAAPRLAGGDATGSLRIAADFFDQGGFNSFDIDGGAAVTIGEGVRIAPRAQQWTAGADARNVASGTRPAQALQQGVLPADQRRPVNLSIAAAGLVLDDAQATGTLSFGPGAVIDADPGARISLSANASLRIDGSIHAAGGQVSLRIDGRGSREGTLRETGYAGEFKVGADARIDVSGTSIVTPTDNGLRQGRVLDGGSIALSVDSGKSAGRQTLIDVAEGAVLRADGARDTFDAPLLTNAGNVTTRQRFDGAAGSIAVKSTEGGARLAGTLQARAADAGAPGGSLVVEQQATAFTALEGGVDEYRIDVHAGALPASDAMARGTAALSAAGVAAGGFGDVTLKTPQRIHFAGDVDLGARRNLLLQSAVLSADADAQVRLRAPTSVRLQADATAPTRGYAAGAGTAGLGVESSLLALGGELTLQGVRRFEAVAGSRVQLEGVAAGTTLQPGALRTLGDVAFDAPQVVTATRADFTLDAAGHRVEFTGGDAASTVPLSAGGSLTVNAATIVQDGVVRAPLGRVSFNATEAITLTERSLTSVSGAGSVVPYGSTSGGKNLAYLDQPVTALPDKAIQLLAPGQAVDVRAGAVLDMSGGGQLVAHEFVPGPGGSTDVFAGAAGGAFAVIPTVRDHAPSDAAIAALTDAAGASAAIPAGRSITFGAGGPLPAGTYAVLPARYALLPGAFLVTPAGSGRVASGYAQQRPDGSALVGATLGSVGTPSTAASTGFVVRSSEQARRYSEVRNTDVDAYLAAAADKAGTALPRLAQDAGSLDIAARQLALAGSNRFTLPTQQLDGHAARGGGVAIAAERIEVDETAGSASDTLYLTPQQLNALGADSLTLGALRGGTEAAGRRLAVSAREVVLGNEREALRAKDIVLAATEQLTLQPGARLVADAAGAAAAPADTLLLQGDGALLRVSADRQASSVRTDASRAAGALDIGAGTLLQGRSLTAEATARTAIDATATLDAEAYTLGAARIAIGEVQPGSVSADTLVLSAALATQLGQAGQATLRSFDSIDFHGDAVLGSAGQRALVLDAGSLRVHGDGARAQVSAGELRLTNTTGAAATAEAGSGSLVLQATGAAGGSGDIVVGPGSVAIAGTADTRLQARRSVVLDGQAALAAAGDLDLAATSLTATQRADASLAATGRLQISPGSAAVAAAPGGAGAHLSLSADRIVQGGTIDLASGTLRLDATGSALPADGAAIRFEAGSTTRLSGQRPVFDGQAVATSGGSLEARAAAGDIVLADGSKVDVSAGGAGAGAGAVDLAATGGRIVLDGALLGSSAPAGSARGARLTLDSAAATDLARLAAALAQPTGDAALANFAGAVSVRNRQGDQRLEAGTRLAAQELTIVSDSGALALAGTLDASASQGGRIRLAAGTDLKVEDGAALLARATVAGRDGGQVQAMTNTGRITLADGARIDTRGFGNGADGELRLRAPRLSAGGLPVADTEAGSEVAVDALGAALQGVGRIEVEAFKTYAATTVNAALIDRVAADNAAFAGAGGAQAQALEARLAAGNASFAADRVEVRAGVELQSAGNLTVTGDPAAGGWNLTPFDAAGAVARDGAAPMNLTLRAAGNLLVQASLSDGFRAGGAAAPASAAAARRIVPEATITGEGGTIRLVGGADLIGADVMSTVVSDSAGDVIVGKARTDVLVRTTTGDLEIAAGRDVQLLNRQAAVYTTGTPVAADLLPGYAAPTVNGASITSGSQRQAALTRGGGSVRVDAGRDAIGATDSATQYVADWWWRGIAGEVGSWWSRYDKFRQGFGALGGNDVTVHAGRDAVQVQAVAPAVGYLAPDAGGANVLHEVASGSVSLSADRDVVAGLVHAGGASAVVSAGSALAAAGDGTALQVLHADTDVVLSAQRDLTLGRVAAAGLLDPVVQWAGSSATFDRRLGGTAAQATLSAVSDAGDLVHTGVRPFNLASGQIVDDDLARILPSEAVFTAPAGSVTVARDSHATQMPAQRSTLLIAAREDVQLGNLRVGGASAAQQAPTLLTGPQREALSADPFAVGQRPLQAGDLEPVRIVSTAGSVVLNDSLSLAVPLRIDAAQDIRQPVGIVGINLQHTQEDDLSLIRAGGDIRLTADAVMSGSSWTVHGPGDLVAMAGGDVDLQASGGLGAAGNRQNAALPAHSARLTVLAGVSVADGDYVNAHQRYFHLLGGSGIEGYAGDLAAQLEALGGGTALPAVGSAAAQAFDALDADARLARARAIVGDAAYDASMLNWMRGRSNDPALTLAAARRQVAALDDLATTALTGRVLGDRWLQRLPGAAQLGAVQAMARADKNAYAADLAAFVAARSGTRPLDTADALARYAALPVEQQLLHMNRVLASELRAAGRAASALGGAERDAAYAAGYRALATVFSNAAAEGDLLLGSSQIKTLQGSGIDLLTPRGGINVGELTAATNGKTSSDLGIVTTAGGAIAMTVRDDVAVNQSRVFTVGRGDLQIWASEGNIDAGRGAKTVTGAPPPVYRLVEGRIVVDTSSSYAGSGIAVLDDASTLDLYAPRGEINAGDAGIKSAGNAYFGAVRLVGADNLQVGGVAVGAPPPPPAAGGTAGLAAAGQSATSAGQRSSGSEDEDERRKRRARRNLMLDFLGFGGERS